LEAGCLVTETKKDKVDRYLIVAEPVVDLRREPIDPEVCRVPDDLLETQLLLNEMLLYCDENEEWYRVEAVEQADFSSEASWLGYPGWVKKKSVREKEIVKRNNVVIKGKGGEILEEPTLTSRTIMSVSMGTRFHATGESAGGFLKVSFPEGGDGWVAKRGTRKMAWRPGPKQLRESVVSTARSFLGVPYLWGGRSVTATNRGSGISARAGMSGDRGLEVDGPAHGIDCSGLTNLVFRVNNIDIPRNAHIQWMVTPKIPAEAMKPGDLIFVSKEEEFFKINHVMIYLGGEEFIEALETGTLVKVHTFVGRFGRPLSQLVKEGLVVDNKKIYCGKMPVFKSLS
jgi:gamma-D-glutamyl-L-lysine dipeptidyl-peptidase